MGSERAWAEMMLALFSSPDYRAYMIDSELSAPVMRLDEDLAFRRLPHGVKLRRQAERNVDRFLAAETLALRAELGAGDGHGTG